MAEPDELTEGWLKAREFSLPWANTSTTLARYGTVKLRGLSELQWQKVTSDLDGTFIYNELHPGAEIIIIYLQELRLLAFSAHFCFVDDGGAGLGAVMIYCCLFAYSLTRSCCRVCVFFLYYDPCSRCKTDRFGPQAFVSFEFY